MGVWSTLYMEGIHYSCTWISERNSWLPPSFKMLGSEFLMSLWMLKPIEKKERNHPRIVNEEYIPLKFNKILIIDSQCKLVNLFLLPLYSNMFVQSLKQLPPLLQDFIPLKTFILTIDNCLKNLEWILNLFQGHMFNILKKLAGDKLQTGNGLDTVCDVNASWFHQAFLTFSVVWALLHFNLHYFFYGCYLYN